MTTGTLASQLRETLASSRLALDAWVAAERRYIDEQVAAAQQETAVQQRELDAAAAQLLAVQLQHGCRLTGDKSSRTKDEGSNSLSEQRQEQESRVQQQAVANDRMKARVEELKKQLEGGYLISDGCAIDFVTTNMLIFYMLFG
jgi:hypothetical protein